MPVSEFYSLFHDAEYTPDKPLQLVRVRQHYNNPLTLLTQLSRTLELKQNHLRSTAAVRQGDREFIEAAMKLSATVLAATQVYPVRLHLLQKLGESVSPPEIATIAIDGRQRVRIMDTDLVYSKRDEVFPAYRKASSTRCYNFLTSPSDLVVSCEINMGEAQILADYLGRHVLPHHGIGRFVFLNELWKWARFLDPVDLSLRTFMRHNCQQLLELAKIAIAADKLCRNYEAVITSKPVTATWNFEEGV